SATPLREHIALAIPPPLRSAASAGIALLLTFIGLRNAGLIVGDPSTLVRMGALDHRAVFLLLGILVAAALMRRSNPLAFLAAIFSATALAWTLGYAKPPDTLASAPDVASVVTALCFMPCFFLGPLAAAVPGYATAAVLVLVGVSMFQSISTIEFSSLEDALPAFVTVVLIPLTLSITQGILWGFLLHTLL